MAYEYYAVDLPGKMLYTKDFNIKIRRITPIEQRYIISLGQKQQATNKDYLDFIKKLVEFDNPEMKFEELFWYDVQYLLYRIRFTTYPSYPPKVMFECTGTKKDPYGMDTPCTQKITQELDLGKLTIKTPDDNPKFTKEIQLEKLGTVAIRPKIMQDDLEIETFMNKRGIKEDDVDMRYLLVELCLIKGDKTLEEAYALAEQDEITAEDIVKVEQWFADNIFGVVEQMTVKCPTCGKEEVRDYYIDLAGFFSVV